MNLRGSKKIDEHVDKIMGFLSGEPGLIETFVWGVDTGRGYMLRRDMANIARNFERDHN